MRGISGFTTASLLALSAAGAQAAIVRGVNLGGWLVTEPWMTPSLFSETNTTCEWELCAALGKDECLKQLQNHWSTFYTRDDLSAIKDAGLTAVRIPLGYWMVDLLDYEPYVSGQYPYLIQAVQWAKEFGLHVFLDLHGVPGSQNGWEETGIVGPIEFPANSSNSDRSLNVLRNLTTEFTKDIYGGVVTNIELVNEPIFANDALQEFYTAGANVVGAANSSGINTTISDAFYNPVTWKNFDPYSSSHFGDGPREFMTVDTHQFWAFPPLNDLTEPEILTQICSFGATLKEPNSGIPPTLVGEFSLSTGITANSSSNTEQDQDKRTWFRTLFEAQNAAYTPHGPNQSSIGWYFWAWKTEYDIDAWSYRKGIADGYIPSNVSDPSTYVFPVLDTGCIDQNFTYAAPKTVSSSASPTASATGSASGKPSGTSGASTASGSAKSAASGVLPVWTQLCLAIGAAALMSVS